LRSSEPYFTAEGPLSAANIAEKLQNKFVIIAVDTDDVVEAYLGDRDYIMRMLYKNCY